jgi:uncharacterized protein (DUF4415 family)
MMLHNSRNGGRKPEGDRPKAKINITIDADLLEWIKSQGQVSPIINSILRANFLNSDRES